jgi:hypothetical protein
MPQKSRIPGGVLAAAGVCWFIYWFAETFDVQPLVPSAAQIGLAVAGVFLGLLIIGFGELYRMLAAIESNTRIQGVFLTPRQKFFPAKTIISPYRPFTICVGLSVS